MSVVGEFIENVVGSALREVLRKTGVGTGKRRRRRTGSASATTLKKIEKLLKPKPKRQVSRRRTVRARSKVKRRAV